MTLRKAKQIIETGKEYIGTPYLFDAAAGRTDRFDCSSFVQYVYAAHGISLPRTSRQQFQAGNPVPLSSVRRGDLLFFTTPKRTNLSGIQRIGHVAIFIGNNSILHTSRVEKKVAIASLSPYWNTKIIGARRVIG
ncbi:C40 family peptidase [Sutcliffiella horikoshii]|uniref:C40 family peptidase n=1 Tax=Sutcliffiella horikoshii TaxID=79883 RepID=UPI001F3FF11F|nr:C40 family peptidase [Sutcliffiella horikoshii]MCG1023782.1 NlpC/P60 family protein [Sutcliffiella horikoshii]